MSTSSTAAQQQSKSRSSASSTAETARLRAKPSASQQTTQQHNDLLCRPRYAGQLPPLPFPTKLIKLPPTVERFSNFRHTTLVQKTMYPLMTGRDLGMPLDMAALGAFDAAAGIASANAGKPVQQDPRDKMLLAPLSGTPAEGRNAAGAGGGASATPPRGRPNVPWLRRTEYLSLEMGRSQGMKMARQNSDDAGAGRVDELDCSAKAQLGLIDESFKSAGQLNAATLRHPRNPSLRAAEIIPFIPFDIGRASSTDKLAQDTTAATAYTHCVLEQPPGALKSGQKEYSPSSMEMRKADSAIFKPMESARSGEKFLACYVPTDKATVTLDAALQEPSIEQELDYQFTRDYGYEATPGESGRQIMLLLRPGAYAGYAELPTKLVLRRRRRQSTDEDASTRPRKMLVRMAGASES